MGFRLVDSKVIRNFVTDLETKALTIKTKEV